MEIDGAALLAKGAYIADALYRHCFLPDEGVRMRRTASVSPGTSLKHSAARKAFQWAADVGGGKFFFTLAACRKGVQLLLKKPDVVVPFVGLPQNLWVESQAKMVMKLAQRARKNSGASLRFWAYHQSKLMDWEDTLPVEAGLSFQLCEFFRIWLLKSICVNPFDFFRISCSASPQYRSSPPSWAPKPFVAEGPLFHEFRHDDIVHCSPTEVVADQPLKL